MNGSNHYETLQVKWENDICFLQLYRPHNKNTINDLMIAECKQVIAECETKAKVIILEGLKEVFCFGADFDALAETESVHANDPEPLYDLWLDLAQGSFITVAHVEGQANAGGMGFVAACDLVLAGSDASFSLSELLFGLMPACVLPFLIRKIGFQKAHAMTVMTKPITVQEAHEWGLVDKYDSNSALLLRRELSRLRRLNKVAIRRYKNYISSLNSFLKDSKQKALDANLQVFGDQENREKITRYIKTGTFPWE